MLQSKAFPQIEPARERGTRTTRADFQREMSPVRFTVWLPSALVTSSVNCRAPSQSVRHENDHGARGCRRRAGFVDDFHISRFRCDTHAAASPTRLAGRTTTSTRLSLIMMGEMTTWPVPPASPFASRNNEASSSAPSTRRMPRCPQSVRQGRESTAAGQPGRGPPGIHVVGMVAFGQGQRAVAKHPAAEQQVAAGDQHQVARSTPFSTVPVR